MSFSVGYHLTLITKNVLFAAKNAKHELYSTIEESLMEALGFRRDNLLIINTRVLHKPGLVIGQNITLLTTCAFCEDLQVARVKKNGVAVQVLT